MRIGLATTGLLPLRPAIEKCLGGKSVLLSRSLRTPDVVVGWGHKETSVKARRIAHTKKIPYIAFEDGFIRSVAPGRAELPASLVLDRSGIYYNARMPSDLETLVRRRASLVGNRSLAKVAMGSLKRCRLSKYNNFLDDEIRCLSQFGPWKESVLVVDQTMADASISGAFADASTFNTMLECAVKDNPDSSILVKTHPETELGYKGGHYSHGAIASLFDASPTIQEAWSDDRLHLLQEFVNPWPLLEACSKIYCVSSQLGFEGLMAGCEVHCFGLPFYAGWGLTKDRLRSPRRRTKASLFDLVSAVYFDYCRYFDHSTGQFLDFEDAVNSLVDRRNQFRKNRVITKATRTLVNNSASRV